MPPPSRPALFSEMIVLLTTSVLPEPTKMAPPRPWAWQFRILTFRRVRLAFWPTSTQPPSAGLAAPPKARPFTSERPSKCTSLTPSASVKCLLQHQRHKKCNQMRFIILFVCSCIMYGTRKANTWNYSCNQLWRLLCNASKMCCQVGRTKGLWQQESLLWELRCCIQHKHRPESWWWFQQALPPQNSPNLCPLGWPQQL